MDNRKWGYSFDEEHYFGPFETREQALTAAKVDAEERAVTIYLCRCRPETFEAALLNAIDGERILDDADQRICEDDIAYVEDRMFEQGERAARELTIALQAVAMAWLKKYPCRSWFHADDVERIGTGEESVRRR